MSTAPINPDADDQANEPIPLRRSDEEGDRVYSVDGTTGEVRDWRRPETGENEIRTTEATFRNGTGQVGDPVLIGGRRGKVEQFLFVPARTAKKNKRAAGWDVVISFEEGEPKERKLNPADVDLLLDEITRPAKSLADQTTTYGVPTDASFGDDDVKLAGDLRQIGVGLVQETEDFPKLRTVEVAYFWVKKGGSSGGVPNLSGTKLADKFMKKLAGAKLMVWVAADHARALMLRREEIEAVVHERLCSLDRDEHGNFKRKAPDFRGYSKNVARFGATVPTVKAAAVALKVEVKDVRTMRMDLGSTEEVDVGV